MRKKYTDIRAKNERINEGSKKYGKRRRFYQTVGSEMNCIVSLASVVGREKTVSPTDKK